MCNPDTIEVHCRVDKVFGQGAVGAIPIFGSSQAYDEEKKVYLARLWNWIKRMGLKMDCLEPVRHGAGAVMTELAPEPGVPLSGPRLTLALDQVRMMES